MTVHQAIMQAECIGCRADGSVRRAGAADALDQLALSLSIPMCEFSTQADL